MMCAECSSLAIPKFLFAYLKKSVNSAKYCCQPQITLVIFDSLTLDYMRQLKLQLQPTIAYYQLHLRVARPGRQLILAPRKQNYAALEGVLV